MLVRFQDNVIKILREISSLSAEMNYNVFLVGGPARDTILNIPLKDIDVMVLEDGITFAKEFGRRNNKNVKIFKDFLTAKIPDMNIDFSTARKESYSFNGSLPVVSKGTFNDDIKRRDFTINAICISLKRENFGEVIDITGGVDDLNKKTLRILHKDSFKDDATRILRGVRFKARFGFEFSRDTEKILKEDKIFLNTISFERLLRELFLICKEDGKGLKFLKAYGLEKIIKIDIPDEELNTILELSSKYKIENVKSIISFLFYNDAERLNMREYKKNLKIIKEFPRSFFDVSKALKVDLEFLPLFYVKSIHKKDILKLIEERDNLSVKINGDEMKKFGIFGKECGRVKNQIIEERWKGNIKDKKDEIKFIKRRIIGYK